LTGVERMRDGLGVIRRKHSILGVRTHNIKSITPRKIKAISPLWIEIRGKWAIFGSLIGHVNMFLTSREEVSKVRTRTQCTT